MIDFIQKLEAAFPLCHFDLKGDKITILDGSHVDTDAAVDFTKLSHPYRFGLHESLADFIEEAGFYVQVDDEHIQIVN